MSQVFGDDSRARLVFLGNVVIWDRGGDGSTGLGSDIFEGACSGNVDLRFAQLGVIQKQSSFGRAVACQLEALCRQGEMEI